MIFNINDSMATAIIENPDILFINDRFNIKLGFRELNIEEVCKKNNVNPEFYLAIINTYSNVNYFDTNNLKKFSPILIVSYLRKTHKYYLNNALPKLKLGLNKLIESYNGKSNEIELIYSFYNQI